MQKALHRVGVLAAVVVLAAGSTNCAGDIGNSSSDRGSFSSLGPSALGESVDPALSARGGNGKPTGGSGGGSSSLTLEMVNDLNADGLPNWGDSVTFNVSTTATTEPHVDLTCYQNGSLVLGATTGYYASYPWPWTQTMTLSSTMWQGGAADCTATLYYFDGRKSPVLASLRFTANG